MPFTPSHAVVALPFLRTPLIPAAIAVGAMTPDLPLFLRGVGLSYTVSHDLRWLPVTIAVALVLLLLWRGVLRPAVRELSPLVLARRLPAQWDGGFRAALRETFPVSGVPARVSWRGILLLVVSLAIGVASHIVWDAFTHEGRDGVALIPGLDEQWGPFVGYKWLQYGSSAFGLIVIAVWGAMWLARRRAAAMPERMLPQAIRVLWWLSLPVILLIGWGIGLVIYGPITASFTPAHLAYRTLPLACTAWGLLTVSLCIAIQVRTRGRHLR